MTPRLSSDALRQLYEGQRVAVLGASGFIGRWVAQRLTACGAHLSLVARDAKGMDALLRPYEIRGEVVTQNLANLEAVRELLTALRPTIVFNLAGYGVDRSERDEAAAFTINADLVRTVAEALATVRDSTWGGQDLVHVGSALEYGIATGDLAEDSEPRPRTLYGQSKLAGTQALTEVCSARGLRGITARLFTVYGPGEHENRLVPSLLQAAEAKRPLDLSAGQQKRDFTFVGDVGDVLLHLGATQARPGEVVNVASGTLTSVRHFTERAARTLGMDPSLLRFGAVPVREEEMEHQPISVERLKNRIGWLPETSVKEGIRQTEAFRRRVAPP